MQLVNRSRRGSAVRALAAAAVVAAALAGCSSGSNSTHSHANPATSSAAANSSAPAASAQISIKNFAFSPGVIKVRAGQTVTVKNNDSTTHTVTATGSKSFDTGDIPAGGTKTFTAPSKPGTYPYICSIHTFMHGTLTVS